MPNIKISDLPPATLPLTGPSTFLEVSVLEAGVEVSRKATADDVAGAGGAPANATYVTISLDAGLSDERTLAAGFGLTLTDGGAGNPVTLAFDVAESPVVVTGSWTFNRPAGGTTFGPSNEVNFRNIADDSTTFIQALNGSIAWGIAGAGAGVDFMDFGSAFVHYEFGNPIFIDETAAAVADQAGKGQFWVRDDVPNVPMFTDDAGTDFVLNDTGGAAYFSLSATGRVIGSDAGTSQTGNNVFLGGAAAGDLNVADGVIAIGQNALAAAVELEFAGSIAIGRNAGLLIGDTRDPWLIIGDNAAAAVTPRTFHDGNTIIGTRALTALGSTATVQNVTVIGHDALSDMTGASGLGVSNNVVVIGSDAGTGNVGASVTSAVLIGAGVCNDLQAGGVSGSVVIGNNTGERLGGASLNVLIGSNNTQNAINVDTCIVIGCNTFGIGSAQTANQILIGHSAFPGLLAGEKNVLIGNSLGITGAQQDFNGSVIIGHQAGYNMIDDQDIFAIEQPQGSTSAVARPYLFGNILNGNLALLNIAAMTGGIETGTRIVPAWADAAPAAGQGVFSMYGAGTDLAATTDTDFVHFYVRSADNNMMFRFEDGTEIALASAAVTPAAGVMAIRSVGSTDSENRSVALSHLDGTERARYGYLAAAGTVLRIDNLIDAGNIQIIGTNLSSVERQMINCDPDGAVDIRHPASDVEVAHTATLANGGFEVNNTVTGAGFERVLTTSDIGIPFIDVTKTADESVSTSTVLQDDDALVVTMASDTRYMFEAYIPFTENGGDILMDWAFTNAPQNSQASYNMIGATADEPHDQHVANLTTNVIFNPTTTNQEYGIHIQGFVRSNATTGGTMQFRWAQNISDANATIVREGAWMRLHLVT